MDGELIFFGYLPALISAAVLVCSFLLFAGYRKSLLNGIFVVLIFLLNGIAQSFFLPMIKGAYPTFIPHILVLVSIPVFIWQYKMYKKYWP